MSGYTIAGLWKGSRPYAPAYPSAAALDKMGGLRRMRISKAERDAAAFADLDPALRSRVFQAVKDSANGVTSPDVSLLIEQVEAMLARGDMTPSAGAAILRMLRDDYDEEPHHGEGALDVAGSQRGYDPSARPFYDPTRPAPGKAARKSAGGFAKLVQGYALSRGIGRWR